VLEKIRIGGSCDDRRTQASGSGNYENALDSRWPKFRNGRRNWRGFVMIPGCGCRGVDCVTSKPTVERRLFTVFSHWRRHTTLTFADSLDSTA